MDSETQQHDPDSYIEKLQALLSEEQAKVKRLEAALRKLISAAQADASINPHCMCDLCKARMDAEKVLGP